ncbi:type 2C protein phosphatase PTC5 KNAG_0I01070 [Huiozyma naganishii CBS 8797]|uniref:PPM-type phosphatase domain-containing protein n=1 Tax=Huiozyma naganishii (strain ATCC MYA-139 / BCRC 22969 / CBS 8797 / KCTC 17520 / NBRC 10181 / NCYC 3082 / Yp74L-3) TaxID=1071383 RepID=J7RQ50_HUIN7|nr:hypothetical protein KNAG_0I01070 [Kazachstania naganishii CBS 8797]CCK71898.1 hypothetical protein KNAG_0I01070 [Kazachstania naganishii CBS 8797]
MSPLHVKGSRWSQCVVPPVRALRMWSRVPGRQSVARWYSVGVRARAVKSTPRGFSWPMAVGAVSSVVGYVAYNRFLSTGGVSLESRSTEPVSGALPTLEQIEAKLHAREKSFWINRNTGVFRFDVSQLPSNNPIEDSHVEQIIALPGDGSRDLYFFGIFDGHGGPFTSSKLAKELVPYVLKRMLHNGLDAADSTLRDAFVSFDHEVVIESFKNLFADPMNRGNVDNILPAVSGSCALLSVFDSKTDSLKVAVTGDSRTLVVGQNETDGKWFVKSCTIDQTGDNPKEVERIQGEHPGEPNVVRRGRILGSLQPSRAFGDHRYKVKEVEGKTLDSLPEHVKLYLRREPKDFLTPPYVTARPEVTTAAIARDNIKFMVMGSDGLFELLTNEEIASLVIKWADRYMPNNKVGEQLRGLPPVEDISAEKESQRLAFRYKDKAPAGGQGFLLQDANVATHLIRNALSAGGRPEYVSTLVSIPAPMSRKYRDDLTVTVAFFGPDSESITHNNSQQGMSINYEASTKPRANL